MRGSPTKNDLHSAIEEMPAHYSDSISSLKNLEHKAELMAACLEAIESYEEDPEPSLRVQTGVWVYNTTSRGATYG